MTIPFSKVWFYCYGEAVMITTFTTEINLHVLSQKETVQFVLTKRDVPLTFAVTMKEPAMLA